MYYVKNKLSRFTVLQFKVNLHSRTTPGLAYWCVRINVQQFLEQHNYCIHCCAAQSLQLFLLLSRLCQFVCHINTPTIRNRFFKCLWIHPSLPPSSEEQLAWTAGFSSCLPSHFWPISIWARVSTALSFLKSAFLYLNQSLCYLCVTIQQKAHWNQKPETSVVFFWHLIHLRCLYLLS